MHHFSAGKVWCCLDSSTLIVYVFIINLFAGLHIFINCIWCHSSGWLMPSASFFLQWGAAVQYASQSSSKLPQKYILLNFIAYFCDSMSAWQWVTNTKYILKQIFVSKMIRYPPQNNTSRRIAHIQHRGLGLGWELVEYWFPSTSNPLL